MQRKNFSSLRGTIFEKIKKNIKIAPLKKISNFLQFFLIFSGMVFCRELRFFAVHSVHHYAHKGGLFWFLSKMFSKVFFLKLMAFLMHINFRPNKMSRISYRYPPYYPVCYNRLSDSHYPVCSRLTSHFQACWWSAVGAVTLPEVWSSGRPAWPAACLTSVETCTMDPQWALSRTPSWLVTMTVVTSCRKVPGSRWPICDMWGEGTPVKWLMTRYC